MSESILGLQLPTFPCAVLCAGEAANGRKVGFNFKGSITAVNMPAAPTAPGRALSEAVTDPEADPYEAFEVQWDYVEPPPPKLAAQLAAAAAATLAVQQMEEADGEFEGDAAAATGGAALPPLIMQGGVTPQALEERDRIKRVSPWQIASDPDDERRATEPGHNSNICVLFEPAPARATGV